MKFSIEESKENDLIIKKKPETSNRGQFNLFSLTLQDSVRINDQGAPLLGLAKSILSIYYDVE